MFIGSLKRKISRPLAKGRERGYCWAMEFLRKARERGLTPGNALSWLCLGPFSRLAGFSSTLRLYAKARLLGVRIGRGARAHGPVSLLRWPGGEISIGAGTSFVSSCRRATACSLAWPCRLRVFGPGAVIEIGDGCELSGASITARSTLIRLGRGVLLAPNCVIVDSDFHAPWPAESRSRDPGYGRDRGVEIGDYAWIGMGAIILKGVKIGAGAIIGAGSVVTRDIPENSVACGAPCIVRKRASDAGLDGAPRKAAGEGHGRPA